MTTLYRQITFLVGKSLDNKTLGQEKKIQVISRDIRTKNHIH